ncbi:uncharacterized protein LOC103989935 isoform X3 [Musa acuminata AAA Group]|uniref:uncharacterized protein LOC103989935 isoform X3 n=1 Tax=Musa acuminata AAA Group TaxID=214697 RepID=UPI0031E1AEBE
MTKSQGSGMGRYARKAKIDGKAAVTEAVHHQPSLGVHTRAKTLALKRLQETSPDTASCYLQLRSRCLEKHLPVPSSARSRAATRNRPNADPNPNSHASPSRSPNHVNQAAGAAESPVNSDSVGSVPTKSRCFTKTKPTALAVREVSPEVDPAETEGSFGENVLDLDASRLDFKRFSCTFSLLLKLHRCEISSTGAPFHLKSIMFVFGVTEISGLRENPHLVI